MSAQNTFCIYVRIKHFRSGNVQIVPHQENLLIARIQDTAHPHDQHHDNGTSDCRKGNMPHQSPAPRAVHSGSLIQFLIHTGKSRKEYNGAIPCLTPDILTYNQSPERGRIRQNIKCLTCNGSVNHIKNTVRHIKKLIS